MSKTELMDPATDLVAAYVRKLSQNSPAEAVEIALAEADKYRAKAELQNAEYRAMAEVEFNPDGSIVKANMAGLFRLASGYARTMIVPEHYQGKPDDCFIACQMAMRLGMDPLAYMQGSYIVHGKPGIEAKISIALLNQSGKIKGRIWWDDQGTGDSQQSTANAVDSATGKTVSATVTMKMVKAEGWFSKKGSKWQTMPDIMFHYRSATFLVRQFYPEVTMGMATVEELHDSATEETERPVITTLDDVTDNLKSKAKEKGKGKGTGPKGKTTPEKPQDETEPTGETITDEEMVGLERAMEQAAEEHDKNMVNKFANDAADNYPGSAKDIFKLRDTYSKLAIKK